jgi:hypothetical protein
MSSIRWERAGGGVRRLPILIHTPRRSSYVKIFGEIQKCFVHWVVGIGNNAPCPGRSQPCYGECCHHCEYSRPREQWYAACLLWNESTNRWVTSILSLNKTFMALLSHIENYHNFVLEFKVAKPEGRSYQYAINRMEGWKGQIPAIEPFDVRPHLEALWGIGDSVQAAAPANVVAAKPNVLKFPPARAG